MHGVAKGAAHPPKQTNKNNLTKIEKKEAKKKKNHKIKEIDKNYHNFVYKWVRSEDYSRG